MNIRTFSRIGLFACAVLAAPTAWCGEKPPMVAFSNHARLVMSVPVPANLVHNFGQGWTQLVFVRPDGAAVRLFSEDPLSANGGIVFSVPRDDAVSADGRYVVIDLVRSGVLDAGDGKPTVTGRQYCPILDTATGCVARDDTGDVCGGKWDAKQSAWLDVVGTGEAQPMTTLPRPTAKDIWTQYSSSKAGGIKGYLDVVHGIDNLKACDPPTANNARYYAAIENALGPATHPPRQAIPAAGTASQNPEQPHQQQILTVKSERAWLYAEPSVGSSHRGYLIRGDQVVVIGNDDSGWLHIRYERVGKPSIEAWLQQRDATQ
ncbi:hypothetical protein [Trinickia sp. Y13]|uniref:hypothetical protein n=1 Tax=Trinickia sp. Y13 TaxID=2917807 RepID=UPI0024063770|nr:hypothetical protein [Trinickia sp. Y13]MDG0027128.1 hypothetical protein [Trinickia sp. Y13]